MHPAAYQIVKKRLLYCMGHDRCAEEEQALWVRIEAECSPQQKTAISRAVYERTQDLDALDMETIG